MADTNALKWLRAQDTAYQTLEYVYDRVGAERAAEAVGKPIGMVCKTLVVEAAGKKHWLAIVPGDQRFNAKLMAQAIGEKSADLADSSVAERVTGYRVGGVSPFATRRPLPVVIETSLTCLDRIIVNGGRRGLLVELQTHDLIRLTRAKSASICRG
jgi:Cys-tRNA(Pro)/Cys-tRNA(Cys) deacylase